jgi:hypothetical protein
MRVYACVYMYICLCVCVCVQVSKEHGKLNMVKDYLKNMRGDQVSAICILPAFWL